MPTPPNLMPDAGQVTGQLDKCDEKKETLAGRIMFELSIVFGILSTAGSTLAG